MDYDFMRLNDPYEDELHKRLKSSYDQSCFFMYQILFSIPYLQAVQDHGHITLHRLQ